MSSEKQGLDIIYSQSIPRALRAQKDSCLLKKQRCRRSKLIKIRPNLIRIIDFLYTEIHLIRSQLLMVLTHCSFGDTMVLIRCSFGAPWVNFRLPKIVVLNHLFKRRSSKHIALSK